MGVSLQTYRVRIGSFKSLVRIKSDRNLTGTNFSLPQWNYKMTIMIILFLGSLVLLSYLCSAIPVTASQPPGALQNSFKNLSTSIFVRTRCTLTLELASYLLRPAVSARITHKKHNKSVRVVNGNRGHGIKLTHWNKGPSFLTNCHSDISSIIASYRPHLLGLSEANLKNTHDVTLAQHVDYQLHTCTTMSNPDLGISRVVVYTHKSLIVKRRTDLDDNSISAIWLEVGLPRHKKIIICQAYREWGYLGQGNGNTSGTIQAQLARWAVFLDKWEMALHEGKEVIVMMDANLDFLKWSESNLPATDQTARLKPLIEQLFSRIFTLGVSQLVTTATRAWPGQRESGLDHLYSNKPDKLSPVEAEFTGMSDHKIIRVTRFSKSFKRNVRYVRKRSYKNFNPVEFYRAVQELSWWDIYTSEDANTAGTLLTNKLSTILDKLAPIKTFQVRNKYAPWLSDRTKILIKQRNEAQKIAADSKNLDDWRLYKNLRNAAKSRMRKERKSWEKEKLDSTHHNPSSLWQNVKGWLNWTNTGPPSQLFHLGRMVTSPAALATTMNTFFLDKVTRLRSNIPRSNTDPLSKLREYMEGRDSTMQFRPVKPKEVLDIIKGLKNSKSTGVDFIDTAVIKLVAIEILPAVTHIVNISLTQSEFPTIWKHAKVIPLLKKDDPLIPKNYRPVALLPILSKMLEKVVFLQLVEYLDQYKLLSPNHHGSRYSHNTATALIQMYDHWLEGMEDGQLVAVMMIDLSAAFDMVDHQLLLQKLRLFGLEEKVIKWMESYLQGRKQSVFIDGFLSPPLNVEFGVPQGSILGPLLSSTYYLQMIYQSWFILTQYQSRNQDLIVLCAEVLSAM